MKRPVVGFAGLTHLGLVSAAAAAAKGFPVVAYGTDTAGVADIRAGNLPIAEPDLDDLFRDHAGRLTVTSDLAELGRCDLVYIATDVPTDDEQRSDLTGIEALIRRVIPVLAENAVLVVLCQV